MLCMSVTADTSHDAIGPCEPLWQSPTGDRSMHALIASLSSVLFWGANAAAKATNHSEPACLACAHGGGLGIYCFISFSYVVTVTYHCKKLVKLTGQRTKMIIQSFPSVNCCTYMFKTLLLVRQGYIEFNGIMNRY